MGIITEEARRTVEEAARMKSPLVWLDKSGDFASLVDGWLAAPGTFPYPVYRFYGSYLELMLASKQTLSGKSAVPCVLYMNGFDENDIKQTPVYEACRAGCGWTLRLEGVIREAGKTRLSSDQLDYILSRDELDIAAAETLADGMADREPELDAAIARLGEEGLVIAFLAGSLDLDISLSALKLHFNRVFGMSDDWIADWAGIAAAGSHSRDLAGALAAYLLCVEYAFDLAVEPPSPRIARLARLPEEYRSRAQRLLVELRAKKAPLYAEWEERTELGLRDEEKKLSAEKLGKIDTFRFEADIVLYAALDALLAADWSRAAGYAAPRLAETDEGRSARTFWVKNDAARERMWKWIDAAAKLGREVRDSLEAGAKPATAQAAVAAYVSSDWRVDSLHREFRLVTATINTAVFRERYDDFLAIRSAMNRLYRSWADEGSRHWNALCAREGFAVSREYGQRFFFERALEPALRAGKRTALILVDAFRYELGEALAEMLSEYADDEKPLSALLAELPTVTAVGMNALMPAAKDGLLSPVFDASGKKILGFSSGERQITNPDTRLRALGEFVSGRAEWTDLGAFLGAEGKGSARLSSADLLVIATQDIDTLGEGGTGELGIDYFQPVLARLMQAVEKLRDSGFERIFITADHGFLIGDETVENGHAARLEKAERRHAFDIARNGDQLVSVPLSELGWRTADKESALVLDAGTHFLTNAKPGTFYHGGNSLQERVIPLIAISGGAPFRANGGKYRIRAEALPAVFSANRIRISVESVGTADLFGPESVALRLSSESGGRFIVADAGGARFTGDTFDAPIGRQCVVSFRIEAAREDKTRVTVSPASTLLTVEPVTTVDYFDAERTAPARTEAEGSSDKPIPSGTAAWVFPTGSIPAEYEAAFQHLYRHDKLSETFLRNSLGGTPEASRKARRFAQRIIEWRQYLPFAVTVHHTADGTEYRKG